MLRKLNLKKDRIVDIQAVLSGDGKADGAKTIDFDEWRNQLKKCVWREALKKAQQKPAQTWLRRSGNRCDVRQPRPGRRWQA